MQAKDHDEDFHGSNTALWKTTSSGRVATPVYLPHGAVIDGIFLFYYDNGPGDITCKLFRINPDTNIYAEQFPIQTSGTSTSIRHAVSWRVMAGTRTVNHNVFAYYIDIDFPGGGTDYRVLGVRIHYH
jgi:hypothetical protein